MARMYSRKHGSSGSTRKKREEAPEWVKESPNKLKKIIEDLAEEGKDSMEIGMVLRDQYGVTSVKDILDKKISEILEEKRNEELPEDLRNLIKRTKEVREHLEENKKDSSAIHGLEQLESKIRRLGKYYKKEGRLPEDWKYKPEKGSMIKKFR
ncbi:MAG: 30S ribosomal protein S15 [Candidatus Aenigmatarchaeota archaeon]